MKLNDPARDAREFQGDFSEIDAYLAHQRRLLRLVVAGMVALVLLVAITGCATWHHPFKDAAAFEMDLYDCEVQAAPAVDPYRAMEMKARCMRLKGWRQ